MHGKPRGSPTWRAHFCDLSSVCCKRTEICLFFFFKSSLAFLRLSESDMLRAIAEPSPNYVEWSRNVLENLLLAHTGAVCMCTEPRSPESRVRCMWSLWIPFLEQPCHCWNRWHAAVAVWLSEISHSWNVCPVRRQSRWVFAQSRIVSTLVQC